MNTRKSQSQESSREDVDELGQVDIFIRKRVQCSREIPGKVSYVGAELAKSGMKVLDSIFRAAIIERRLV